MRRIRLCIIQTRRGDVHQHRQHDCKQAGGREGIACQVLILPVARVGCSSCQELDGEPLQCEALHPQDKSVEGSAAHAWEEAQEVIGIGRDGGQDAFHRHRTPVDSLAAVDRSQVRLVLHGKGDDILLPLRGQLEPG